MVPVGTPFHVGSMCTRANIQVMFRFSIFLKFILFMTLISIGSILVSDTDQERAYGSIVKGHGSGLVRLRPFIEMMTLDRTASRLLSPYVSCFPSSCVAPACVCICIGEGS